MREIVILFARGSGTFSTCADAISRTGKSFNPHYEAVSTGLGVVFDATEPLLERLGPFLVGLGGGYLDLTGLSDTEIQFCVTLWNELKYIHEHLALVSSKSSYAAAREDNQAMLWDLAQALRHLDAAAQVCVSLHFSRLDESEEARERVLLQLREFVSPKLIDEWPSFGPDLRRK